MEGHRYLPANAPLWAAMALLVMFLVAVIAALAVTLYSVRASVGLLAVSAVIPIIALALFFLYFERRRRRWSFVGAATLGVLGVSLRLIISAQPQLEVGGGLPLWVTVTYVTLGTFVVGTSVWAVLSWRTADPLGAPAPSRPSREPPSGG